MKAIPQTVLSLFLISAHSLADDVFGQLHCPSDPGKSCQLEWDMTATPRREYVLERFDLDQRSWRPHDSLPNSHVGSFEKALPPGSLVRVRGCENYMRRESCAASVVVWLPYFATSMDELPDSVILKPSGHQLRVHKNHTLYDANMDYNVGLLTNIMNVIDPNDVTPMAFPPVRIVGAEIVGGTIVGDNAPDENIAKMMTKEMYLHNEIYGLWDRLVDKTGDTNIGD